MAILSNPEMVKKMEEIDATLAKARRLVMEVEQSANDRRMLVLSEPLREVGTKLVQAQRANMEAVNVVEGM